MEWVALNETLILTDFPTELRPLYDAWLVDHPDKAGRLAAIIANTAAEIRALIASNPVNQLDEDETKIPLSLLRQAETMIFFTLCMEMGVSVAPEANQSMIRAEITLRTLVYGRYLVTSGIIEGGPSPRYNPAPERPTERTLPLLAAVLALFLGATTAPAAWVKPENPGTQLTEVDPFWTAFRAGELVTIGNNAVGSGDAVAIGTWANSDAGGFAIGSHANGSTFGSVLGFYSVGSLYGAAVGYQANGADHGVAMGYNATGHTYGVAMGYQAAADNYSVAIGANARSVYGLAAGFQASAEGQGAALGWYADAGPSGTAIGYTSRASTNGTAVGSGASVSLHGAAVGMGAGAGLYGAALGSGANGSDSGVAVGYHALGSASNMAIGYRARADVPETLIYGCNTCTSPSAEFPSPTGYMTGYPTNRISIGPDTFNLVDNSALVRGTLYLDGGTGIYFRASFGTGDWLSLSAYVLALDTGATQAVAIVGNSIVTSAYNTASRTLSWSNSAALGSQAFSGDVSISNGLLIICSTGASLRISSTNTGVAIGKGAAAGATSVAIGPSANASEAYDVAIGDSANAYYAGTAVGDAADGRDYGVAIGLSSYGRSFGASVGRLSDSYYYGVAVGNSANGRTYGVALGVDSRAISNVAVGAGTLANAAYSTALGRAVTNSVNESTKARGALYVWQPNRLAAHPTPETNTLILYTLGTNGSGYAMNEGGIAGKITSHNEYGDDTLVTYDDITGIERTVNLTLRDELMLKAEDLKGIQEAIRQSITSRQVQPPRAEREQAKAAERLKDIAAYDALPVEERAGKERPVEYVPVTPAPRPIRPAEYGENPL